MTSTERLGNVIVGAAVDQNLCRQILGAVGCHYDNRHHHRGPSLVEPPLADLLKNVHTDLVTCLHFPWLLRQPEIKQDQIELPGLKLLVGLALARRESEREFPQTLAQKFSYSAVILDNQYSIAHSHRLHPVRWMVHRQYDAYSGPMPWCRLDREFSAMVYIDDALSDW